MRVLIIGCGCRGRLLAGSLVEQGHAVRGTTRDPARFDDLRAAGVEAMLGDPDRVSTLMPALERISLACILLGSASGPLTQLRALHGTRLEMLLTKLVDTTVRGVVYEAQGSVAPELLAGGAGLVRRFGELSLTPTAVLAADPGRPQEWLAAALAAVGEALGGR